MRFSAQSKNKGKKDKELYRSLSFFCYQMRELFGLVEQFSLHAEHLRGLSKTYTYWIRSTFKQFIKEGGIEYIELCTEENIEKWLIYGASEKKWKPSTFRSHHRNLSVVFDWMKEKKIITENPLLNIRKPKLSSTLPKSISLSEGERVLSITKMLKYTYKYETKRNYAIMAIMIFTGVRKRELTLLKIEDINLDKMMISVIEWKGNKDRIIPISSRLATIINEYLVERKRLNKKCEYFFTGAQFDKKMTIEWVDRLIKKVREKSKIYFSAHSLRHSFATLMLEWGCDIYTLSRMMGHSKITTTTIYLSCSPRMMFSSIEKHPLN